MKYLHPLIIPKSILYVLFFIGLLSISLGGFIRIEQLQTFNSSYFYYVGYGLLVFVYFIVLLDILRNNYGGKVFEIIQLFILPFIGLLAFLWTRKEMLNQIDLEEQDSKKSNSKSFLLLSSFVIIGIGTIFKIMHWWGGPTILAVGVITNVFVIVWSVFFVHRKK